MEERGRTPGDPHGRILSPVWMDPRQRDRWQAETRSEAGRDHARFTVWTALLAALALGVSALTIVVAAWPSSG